MSLGVALAKNYPSEEVFEARNFSISCALNDLVGNSNRSFGQRSLSLLRKRFRKPARFSLRSCVHPGRSSSLAGMGCLTRPRRVPGIHLALNCYAQSRRTPTFLSPQISADLDQ